MTNLIELTTGTLGGSVFYGTIRINGNSVSVSNHLTSDKEYTFRMIGKARAGFPMIIEFKSTIKGLPYYHLRTLPMWRC